jgi:hypothetical protein
MAAPGDEPLAPLVRPHDRLDRRMLLALLAGALILRLATYALFGGITHPDEVFQYLEQAHRLVFGQGIIPWEYRTGMRSWAFPGLLAGIMQVVRLVGDGPVEQNAGVAVVLGCLSLVPVGCGFAWGWRSAGPAGALLAGGLNAVWTENLLYSTHALLDAVTASTLLGGLFLLDSATRRQGGRTGVAAGAVLGLTAALRIQLLPLVLLAAVLYGKPSRPFRWGGAIIGFWVVFAAFGLLDDLTLGTPFQSIWYYAWVNQFQGVASSFGVQPWYQYLLNLRWGWDVALPALLASLLAGATCQPRLLAVGLATIALFSLIPHKEARFIYPAVPLLLTVAGIGSARIGAWTLARIGWPLPPVLLGTIGLAAWAALSLAATLHGSLRWAWLEGQGVVAAMHQASADPNACGVAFVGSGEVLFTGGFVHLRTGLRFGHFRSDGPIPSGYDYILTDGVTTPQLPNLTRGPCRANARPTHPQDWPVVCLWHRLDGCQP